jgi:hypothetical protein
MPATPANLHRLDPHPIKLLGESAAVGRIPIVNGDADINRLRCRKRERTASCIGHQLCQRARDTGKSQGETNFGSIFFNMLTGVVYGADCMAKIMLMRR